MNQVKVLFTIAICSIFLAACIPTKKVGTTEPEVTIPMKVEGCNSIAIVKNYTGEPGCQYLLKMEDGSLLLPGDMPSNKVPFYEGAGLKIGYEILNNGDKTVDKSLCTSHDYVAKITCIEQFLLKEDVPASHEECQSIKDPSTFTWMREAIAANKPKRVSEYVYSVGYLYEMQMESGSILYDCLGNLLCNTSESEDCKSLLETLSKPKVILVTNN